MLLIERVYRSYGQHTIILFRRCGCCNTYAIQQEALLAAASAAAQASVRTGPIARPAISSCSVTS